MPYHVSRCGDKRIYMLIERMKFFGVDSCGRPTGLGPRLGCGRLVGFRLHLRLLEQRFNTLVLGHL
jgi:hypothetical protein